MVDSQAVLPLKQTYRNTYKLSLLLICHSLNHQIIAYAHAQTRFLHTVFTRFSCSNVQNWTELINHVTASCAQMYSGDTTVALHLPTQLQSIQITLAMDFPLFYPSKFKKFSMISRTFINFSRSFLYTDND